MADFNKAYKKLSVMEGGYSNHPEDKGGETFRGISRKYHPDWHGWKIINIFKKYHPGNYIQIIEKNDILSELTEQFYKKEYWDYYNADKIKYQYIANELLESSVNFGKSTTTKFLQTALCLLNRNESLYKDVKIDGVFGPNTEKAMKKCICVDGVYLFNLLNIQQGCKYIDIGNETFIRGWIKRVKIKKNGGNKWN